MVMIERELKFGIENKELVRRKLLELNARLLKRAEQVDCYFNHPCRSFLETDEVLRLRVEGSVALLTYKGPRAFARPKIREEVEVEVGEHELVRRLLLSLGFKEQMRIVKAREEYELWGLRLSLDSVEGLGDFLEAEVPKGMEHALEKLMRELRLDVSLAIDKSYAELISERKANRCY